MHSEPKEAPKKFIRCRFLFGYDDEPRVRAWSVKTINNTSPSRVTLVDTWTGVIGA